MPTRCAYIQDEHYNTQGAEYFERDMVWYVSGGVMPDVEVALHECPWKALFFRYPTARPDILTPLLRCRGDSGKIIGVVDLYKGVTL